MRKIKKDQISTPEDREKFLLCDILLSKAEGIDYPHILWGKRPDSTQEYGWREESFRQYEYDLDPKSPTCLKLRLFVKHPENHFSYCTKKVHNGSYQLILFTLPELMKLSLEELRIIYVDFD